MCEEERKRVAAKIWTEEKIELIQTHAEALNEKFPFKNLKQDTRKRDPLKERVLLTAAKRSFVRFMIDNVDCCQKIYYSNGCNSYRWWVPANFLAYVESGLEREQLQNLAQAEPTEKRRAVL